MVVPLQNTYNPAQFEEVTHIEGWSVKDVHFKWSGGADEPAIRIDREGCVIEGLSLECVGGGDGIHIASLGHSLRDCHLLTNKGGPGATDYFGGDPTQAEVPRLGIGMKFIGAISLDVWNPRIFGFDFGMRCFHGSSPGGTADFACNGLNIYGGRVYLCRSTAFSVEPTTAPLHDDDGLIETAIYKTVFEGCGVSQMDIRSSRVRGKIRAHLEAGNTMNTHQLLVGHNRTAVDNNPLTFSEGSASDSVVDDGPGFATAVVQENNCTGIVFEEAFLAGHVWTNQDVGQDPNWLPRTGVNPIFSATEFI